MLALPNRCLQTFWLHIFCEICPLAEHGKCGRTSKSGQDHPFPYMNSTGICNISICSNISDAGRRNNCYKWIIAAIFSVPLGGKASHAKICPNDAPYAVPQISVLLSHREKTAEHIIMMGKLAAFHICTD